MKKNIVKKLLAILILMVSVMSFVRVETKAAYSYVDPESELRGVWVTPIVDSALVNYTTEAEFKSNMEYIFNVLNEYNLNTLIFHVRQMNDALYESEINPVYSGWSKVDFDVFDPLAWLIDECHKRGIEFHAWMNPYRVKSNSSPSAEELAQTYANYPKNSASDPDNLLVYNGKAILNPGLEAVREHVVDTVIEFVSKYDVDAVHFDDYFYIGMEANGATSGSTTILNEADNQLYIDFCNNFSNLSEDLKAEYTYYRSSYDVNTASHKADWRRVQCNLFFKQLNEAVSSFNQTNNKYIQIGVAPTGIYKNGNGTVTYDSNGWPVTNGSNTGGQTHYSSYLFSDTVRWCCMSWIDYIMPQSYWATDHSTAGYYNVMGWWNKVVKNLDVNLYSGIGLYMGETVTSTKWYTDTDELYTQLNHITTLENVDGASIYNFAHLRKKYDGGTSMSAEQVANLGVNCWKNKVVQPELKSMSAVELGKVPNFKVNANTLTWDKLDNAKFYAIYRSSDEVTFAASQLIDVVGGKEDAFEWTDSENGVFQYGIKALSYTNTLGIGTLPNTKFGVTLGNGASIRSTGVHQGLKFSATVETLDEATEHGFYIALGEYSSQDFINAINEESGYINENKLLNRVISGSGLKFNAIIYNIDEANYHQDISVVAYVKYFDSELEKEVVEYSSSLTRNIAEVAIAAFEDGETSEFVSNIYNKVYYTTLNLNGGKLPIEDSFTITKYNSGSNTGTNLTIGTSSSPTSATGVYWARILVKYDTSLGLYKIVGVLKSGDSLSSFTDSYDYIIGGHSAAEDTDGLSSIERIVNKANATDYYLRFTAPTITDCNVLVELVTKEYASNKMRLEKGVELPIPTKDNQIFMGWYKNADFSGEKVTVHDGASTNYYAKFLAELPTISLTTNEVIIFNQVTPNIIVDANLTDYIYKLSGTNLNESYQTITYELGVNLFKTIKDALDASSSGQTIFLFDGTYNEDLVFDKGITLIGANYNVNGNSSRSEEAIVSGKLSILANNITINGIKISGGSNDDTIAPISIGAVNGFTLVNCVVDQLYGSTDQNKYGNNRRPSIAQLKDVESSNIIISNNKFDYTNHTSTYLKYVAAFNDVNTLTFTNNTISGSTHNSQMFYLYGSSGNITVYGNTEGYTYTNAGSGVIVTE